MTKYFSQMEIQTQKLASGNFQVRFRYNGFYGYLLVGPQIDANEISEKILRHVEAFMFPEKYLQRNLYSMGKINLQSGRVLVFREQAHSLAA